MEEEKLTLGKKIQKLRKESKLSQVGLSDLLHISDKTISKWENDKSIPDIMMINQLSKIFKVPLNYLLGDKVNAWILFKEYMKAFKNIIKRNLLKIIVTLALIYFGLFYFNNHDTTRIYSLKADDNEITFDKGYFIESKAKNILVVTNIKVLNTEYEILTVKTSLYTIVNGDKIIFYEQDNLNSINIEELYGYDEIFTKEKIEAIKKSLYLTIESVDTKNEVHSYEVKLDVVDKFSNNKLFYFENKPNKIKAGTTIEEPIIDIELDEVKLLNNGFKKDENTGLYTKASEGIKFVIDLKQSKITIYKESKTESAIYGIHLSKNILEARIKNKEKDIETNYFYNYKNENLECHQGECENYLSNYTYVVKLINSIK